MKNSLLKMEFRLTLRRNPLLERLRTQGKVSILVAEGQKCIGVIALSDVLRPEANDMVSRLSDMRTRTVLLTGDHQKTADILHSRLESLKSGRNFYPKKKCRALRNYRQKITGSA